MSIGWSQNLEIQAKCEEVIHEISDTQGAIVRYQRALEYISVLSATLPNNFKHGNFFGTLAQAALYPDDYKK